MSFIRIALFLLAILTPASAFAQVAWPAESDWQPLLRNGQPVDDVEGDVTGARDIVGDTTDGAAFVYSDATHLMFRLRLDEDPLNNAGTEFRPFSWGVEFETDGNLDDFEALIMVNGISNPDIVTLQQNTVQGTIGDPSDQAEVLVATYQAADNARVVSPAGTMFSGDPDFFLDFAVEWADLMTVGVVPGGSYGIILGSGSSANAFAADIGTSIADEVSEPIECGTNGCGALPLTVDTPGDGDTVDTATPDVTGATEPNTDVELVINAGTADEVIVTVTSDGSGNYTYSPAALPEGTNTIDATVTDGNEVTTVSISFTVDTVAPMVTITDPGNGTATNDATPTIVGTAEANTDVTVVVNAGTADEESAVVTADATGDWTYDVQNALSDGAHTVTATQTDAAGNEGSATSNFDVDTVAPVVSIDAPANNSSTTNRQPTVSGTADPNGDVVVVFNAGTAAESTVTVTADANGDWTAQPAGDLPTGSNSIEATQTDAAGNSGSDSVNVTIDIGGDVAIDTPVEGAALANDTPTISGVGEPGATITITIDGGTGMEQTGTVTVAPNGSWTFTPAMALGDGDHTVDATQDDNGNTSSDSVTFTVDTTAPTISIDNPADASVVADTTPEISGSSSEANTELTITIDAGTADETTATVTIDANGDWSFTPASPLAEGQHTVDVSATDAAGNSGSDSASFEIDANAPFVSIATPAAGATEVDAQPTVSGQATPDTDVTLTFDAGTADEMTVTVTADANGNWTYTPADALGDGEHTIDASVTNVDGETATDSVTFTVGSGEGLTAPSIDDPADGSTIASSTPTISGSAEPNATVDVTVGGTTYSTTADDTGNWSVDVDALDEGEQTVTATQTSGGETSEASTVTFTVDTTPPDLTVDTPAEGDEVSSTPNVSGTAEPGATIEIFVDGVLVGTTTADSDGDWSFDVPEENAIPAGEHLITVVGRDDAGNESSVDVSVTVGTDDDRDGDGLADDVEEMLGTDPDDSDTDGDGLSDGEEVNDWNTDPLDPDTDDDGLDDGREIELNTNPNAADSDFDGLGDGEEVNTLETDPRNPDTDGGGVFDGVEVDRGSDPNDAADDLASGLVLSGGGCSTAPAQGAGAGWLALVGFFLIGRRRRRRS